MFVSSAILNIMLLNCAHATCDMNLLSYFRLNAFLEGFYDIIPMRLISIFNEQELELLISGLPNVDIEDLKANTEYYKYQQNSLQVIVVKKRYVNVDFSGKVREFHLENMW